MPRLREHYEKTVVSHLMEKFGYENALQVPRLKKIAVNIGVGEAIQDAKQLDAAVVDLRTITGQQPKVTTAKKSIATFKLRTGMKIGCMVTLRGARMWEFLDRLVSVALPRVRDFRGLSDRSCDGRGNYSMGISEQVIFPEIDYDKIDKIRGLNITMVTTAKTDEEAIELLTELGVPFRGRKPGGLSGESGGDVPTA
ncbi:50S ribosomal protein L5 [Candidatus Fermentibacteria bacterium]|nr:50S ribosomal protein L5 [Candidatus Fermentibacteria bacterium]